MVVGVVPIAARQSVVLMAVMATVERLNAAEVAAPVDEVLVRTCFAIGGIL